MNKLIDISNKEYTLPNKFNPETDYTIQIDSEHTESISLIVNNAVRGNFVAGKIVFKTSVGENTVKIKSTRTPHLVKTVEVYQIGYAPTPFDSGVIKLYNPNERDFSTNGIKVIQPLKLKEIKKRSLNGWSIEVELDLKDKDIVVQDMLAVIKTKSKLQPQAFRITNIEYTQRKIKFTANHVMYDADNYYIKDSPIGLVNPATVLQRINTKVDKTSPFTYTSDVNNAIDYDFSNKTLLEAMTLIEEMVGGSYEANNWNVKLSNSIGVDRGETIVYGKNLEDIKVFEDWSGVITRIYPVGKEGLRLPESFIDADVQYAIPYTKEIEFNSELEKPEEGDIPLVDLVNELREKALTFLNESKEPRISYEVKSDINQSLEVGDPVQIKHPLISIEATVQEYEYNVLIGRVEKIVFGNYNRSVKKIFDKIKEDIKEVGKQTSKFEQIVGEQTELINGMNKLGHVYIDNNQILILDKLPKETAKNVWRWGLGGLGFSSTGYEGPFTQAWTMDGKFNTEFISAKSITANQLASDVGASLDLSSNTSINLIVSSINTKIEDIELTPGPEGPKGESGSAGADGKGITSTEIRYQKSTSGTETPTGQWQTFIPTVGESEYLWTRITIKYTTGPDSVSYTIGGVGSQGSKGDTGSDGRGISTTVVEYQKSGSGSSVPTGSWSTTLPAVLENEYLWTRTTITYTTGSPSVAYSVGRVGKDGSKGDRGETGARGADGSTGPRGADGTSVQNIVEYYGLSASANTKPTSWTEIVSEATPFPVMTATNKYLWNYEKINFSDGTSQNTVAVVVGVYGDKGQTGNAGVDGRSIVSIADKYLVTSASSGVTRSTDGWIDTPNATTEVNKYLWNYEIITWNKAPLTSYVEPIIIGVHGNKGEKGAVGPQGVPGQPGTKGETTYVWIAYADNANGGGISKSPTNKKYVGYASGQTTPTVSITNPALFTWQLVKGEDGTPGIPGVPGVDGKPVYTWIKYADTPTSGMDDSPTGKKYIGMAFNKPTDIETTNYGDYQWNLMPQNIEIGGRNYLLNSDFSSGGESWDGQFSISEEGAILESVAGGSHLIQNITELEEGDYTVQIWYEVLEGHAPYLFTSGGADMQLPQGAYIFDVSKEYVSFPVTVRSESRFYSIRYASGAPADHLEGKTLVKRIMIEKGNIATDWTPAPEDIDSAITGLGQDFSGLETRVTETTESNMSSINQNKTNIQIGATKTVNVENRIVDLDGKVAILDNTQTTQSGQLVSAFDRISGLVTDLTEVDGRLTSGMATGFEQTKEDFNFKFGQVIQDIQNMDTDNQDRILEFVKYIRFEDGNIILGDINNQLTLKITSDKITFLQNESEVAYLSNNKLFITDGHVTNSLRIGNFEFKPRNNGSLTFGKVE